MTSRLLACAGPLRTAGATGRMPLLPGRTPHGADAPAATRTFSSTLPCRAAAWRRTRARPRSALHGSPGFGHATVQPGHPLAERSYDRVELPAQGAVSLPSEPFSTHGVIMK